MKFNVQPSIPHPRDNLQRTHTPSLHHSIAPPLQHSTTPTLLTLLTLLTLSTPSLAATYAPSSLLPPAPVREYRAAWVSAVGNGDWPSRKDLTSAEQKAELLAILDRAAQLKLNTVILQVRPACDAMYASQIEPWSEYLTGTMGKAPEPFYDPLAFAVEEAHKRGLELHAWFNPYRAHVLASQTPIAPNHVSKTRPQIVRHYGKYLWLDPGEKETRDYSLSVIMDVVRRYDVDGIHFDDYFYPYREKDASGKEMDFPDDASWKRFGAGRKLSRDDWRRENVNVFVQGLYKSIKSAKPWVKFGISPFGIWRPHYPPQIKGLDAYSSLYADSRKWLASGWVDYFAPQLYWAIEPPDQSYPVLLKWWAEQNSKHRILMPGMATTKTRRTWSPEEIVNQIRIARKTPSVAGHIHWNMRSLMRNDSLDSALEREVYSQPALVPPCPWLPNARLKKPLLTASQTGGKVVVKWTLTGPSQPRLWLLQTRSGNDWRTHILPGTQTSFDCGGSGPDVIAISAVDRDGNSSPPATLQQK